MDNIDDYFDDDLVLDEQTLAILDQEEQKYLSQVQQRQPQPPPVVTKKLKTRDGWSPGVGSRTREDEFDDLPEISVTIDGSYGFTDSTTISASSNSSQLPTRQLNAPQTKHQIQNDAAAKRPQPPLPPRSTAQLSQNRPNHILNPPALRPRNGTQNFSNANRPNRVSDQPGLEKQIAELQAHLRELKSENQKIRDALKEATDVRYVKEGEVSILRKNMEKTAQKHAAEIAKMKAAKEEADAKQKRMERQMKEESERLKTQFIFKQQELEASLRRPPASARATRVMKNIPATPVRVPSQIGAWSANQDADTSQQFDDIPPKLPMIRQLPRAAPSGQKTPEATKKSTLLPRFQNSFAVTPLKLGPKNASKGKGKDMGRQGSTEIPHEIASQRTTPLVATPTRQRASDNFDFRNSFDAGLDSDNLFPPVDEDGDTVMLDDADESAISEVEPVEPLNYKAELSRIIMTHTHALANEATFQLLIGLPFSQNLPSAQAKGSTQACQAILVALSNPVDDSDYAICAHQVARSLLLILRGLLAVDPCFPVTALLSLLSSLVLSLPTFTKILLTCGTGGEEDSLLLATICDLAERLAASSSGIARDTLRETLSLVEILLYDIPDDTVTRLSLIPQRISSLVTALNIPRLHELIEDLSRILLLLATYNTIHAQLVAPIDDGGQQGSQGFKDSLLIHHLCTYLLESLNGDPNLNATTRSNLVGFLAQLSLTQAEMLIKSHIVIPTLVYLVAHLSTALWNDDENYFNPLQARSVIRSINQGLFLLHYLVHSSEQNVHLHEKLQRSPHRNLNNLIHMFVVSFGQLSYSDPPEWIDAEGKAELESLAEPARELLDLVVDGPEGDSVWAAYQMEPENESETDEEEREARRMEDGVQF